MSEVAVDLGTYSSPEVQSCPFPFLKKLREEAPVYRDPATGLYIITKFQDIAYVNQNTEIFSNRTPMIINKQSSVSDEVRRRYKERGWPEEHVLAFTDPPEHSWHRALVDKIFTPGYVRQLEPYIQDITDRLIDSFIEAGHADISVDLAVPLPMYIIADQLGVDREDFPSFKIWSSAWVERNDPHCPPDRELELTDHMIDMQNYLAERAERYRKEPQDNLLSKLVHVEVDGKRLEMGQLLMIVQLILVAGNETTTTGIGNTMFMLLQKPELLARVRENPDLIPNVIEEMLRSHCPVPHQYRMTTRDAEVGGVTIPANSIVQVSYMSGNYDAEQWDNPDEFDIDRKGARNHLAFGRGIHFCVGSLLARGEMRIAVRTMLERLKDLRFSDEFPEPQFIPHFQIHTLDHLQVKFTPGKPIVQ
ncbi:hypothetical protein BSL82_04795 [Tardibacter chloracetimidivorans]|uniref:Cytochrome n=1 Tax=Tardibacter chloracetimidivorans TaxID=1921510 RepID=A0A1L3ZSV1_9SPHN|nr:hypothetical protein BSL82_04795 [Tardibacter chloracetimidivorans]